MIRVDRFQDLCKAQGKKQVDLFRLVGRDRFYISDLKKGVKVPIEYVEVWAKELRTTPAYLLGETDQKEKSPAPGGTRLSDIGYYDLNPEHRKIVDDLIRSLAAAQRDQ